jgi:hypothetical protein
MRQVFPYDNVVAGCLVLIVGFALHWVGQLVSVVNWRLAERLRLQDKDAPPEYKVYEHGIAVADVSIGWLYGVVGVGLLLGAQWAYTWAWVPGVVLVYHAISFWAWTANQIRSGHVLYSAAFRLVWIAVNLIAGLMTVIVAWSAV